jgi:hypothetical protein
MKDISGRLTATLAGCIVSLLVLLATMGATFATPDDVSKQISLESPYVQDRTLVLYRLEQIEKKQDEILRRLPLVPAPTE